MQAKYVNSTTTSTTPATVIDASQPVVIRKIIVGNPVSAGNITVFTEGNALSNNTTQIGYKHTFPSFSTTNVNVTPVVIDFRANSTGGSADDGLFCQTGASIAIDQTMQLTVFWDYAQE
jgi:hypothetical protein